MDRRTADSELGTDVAALTNWSPVKPPVMIGASTVYARSGTNGPVERT
jgi:hypothetical protein